MLVGGQATAPALLERARAAGIPVLTTYGSTEMASQIATAAPGDDPPPGASGRVLPHRRLRIRDGQVEVAGETLFAGYLGPDGIDPPPLASGGWFATGDGGRLEDGVLTITGRADGMFISGGENIHPQEIEEVLGVPPGGGARRGRARPRPRVRLPPGGVHPVTSAACRPKTSCRPSSPSGCLATSTPSATIRCRRTPSPPSASPTACG